MGGLGHHPLHPYALQSAAFVVSLLLPSGVFALLGGAWFEEFRRARQQAGRRHEMTVRVGAWLESADPA